MTDVVGPDGGDAAVVMDSATHVPFDGTADVAADQPLDMTETIDRVDAADGPGVADARMESDIPTMIDAGVDSGVAPGDVADAGVDIQPADGGRDAGVDVSMPDTGQDVGTDTSTVDGGCPAPCGPNAACVGGRCTLGSVAQISAGLDHVCVVLTDRTVRCWGGNAFGQLGDGTVTPRHSPIAVLSLAGVAEIRAGHSLTCARMIDGTVRCWGFNQRNQVGDGTDRDRYSPTVVPGLAGVAAIATGSSHVCVRTTDATMRCWGLNGDGEVLGDGTPNFRQIPTPTTVPGLSGVAAIGAGDGLSCAILTGGGVRCFGQNPYGQLGDGTTMTQRLSPTEVPGAFGAAEIGLDGAHSCARMPNGTVRCWGQNNAGEVGDGTTDSRPVPAEIPRLSNVAQLDVGRSHNCVCLTDGTARCWGAGEFGALGDGATLSRSSPVAVNGLSGVAEVSVGELFTCARLTDGTVRCWGFNNQGQTGDGTTVNRLTPVAPLL